ncbi:MAG: hypothetical protein HZB29_05745 [Nitrospinae bacterium]|nr:hypothetical protein [Nitrospinota bacterium]
MKRSKIAAIALCLSAIITGCASGGSGSKGDSGKTSTLHSDGTRNRTYTARTILFSTGPTPVAQERKFTGDLEINVKGGIRSYKFRNDFGGDAKANTTVMVAISGGGAGFSVQDGAGAKLTEQTNGKAYGMAVLFQNKSNTGTNQIKWFFGETLISSVIEGYSQDGTMVYSEVTAYIVQ